MHCQMVSLAYRHRLNSDLGESLQTHLVALCPDLHQGSNHFSLSKQAQEAKAGELLWEAVGRNCHTGTCWDLQIQVRISLDASKYMN